MSTKAKPAASSTRKVEYLPLASLTPDPANPKAHDTEVIDASVGRFGVIDNITLDGRTGFIISGHGRTKTLQAMKERGENPPDGVQVSEDGEWLVPVNTGWSSRTDTEAHAALIALNRSTELGGWVDDALLGLLDDLMEMDEEDGLAGVGFAEEDIEALRKHLDNLQMAEAANAGDLGEDDLAAGLSDPVDIDGHLLRLTVIVEKDKRQEFYAMCADLDYVSDVRDSM